MSKISKTIAYFKRNGLTNTYYAAKERLLESKGVPYNYAKVSEDILESQRKVSVNPSIIISILVPLYETPEKYLREMIESVIKQTYPGWELVLADASASDNVKNVVSEYADVLDGNDTKENRIKYIRLKENKGISENTNAGLAAASGDYIGLLDHDDLLTENALFEVAAVIMKNRVNGINTGFIYSDEDKCNSDGSVFYEPNIKPEFNLDYLLSNNYICHFSVFEASLLKEAGFRKEYDGAQDHDVILRVAGKLALNGEYNKIKHIPKVLYHWRCHEASTAANPESKNYAYEAGRRAVEDFTGVTASHTLHKGFFHADYGRELFTVRKDIGAVGGLVFKGNKITGGVYESSGKIMFENMDKHFSGMMHRAHCTMDAYALDLRYLTPSDEVRDVYEKALFGYQKDYILIKQRGGNAAVISSDKKAVLGDDAAAAIVWKWSRYFAEELHKRGYKLLYDPEYKPGKYEYNSGRNLSETTIPVSVVIPNFNGLDYLGPCLESIYRSDMIPDEIIVVDNASKDGSIDFINKTYPDVKIISHEENYGFTGAVNHGIVASKNPYIFLLNNDTVIEKDCIKNLYEAIGNSDKVFSAGALMLSMDVPEIIDNAGDSYSLLGYARSTMSGKSRFNLKKKEPFEVFTACAGAAMYKRSILNEIGLFDDRHFAYFEDVDLGYRARISGFDNINVPSAVVYHKGSAVTGSKHNRFKVNLSSQNAVLLAVKNQPFLQLLFNIPFLLLGYLVKQAFFTLKGLGFVYFKGTLRGIKMSLSREGRSHKVRYRIKNFKNYFRIQTSMIKATVFLRKT
ncbi:MAG: glycosyltransferase [Lachnospiraceae bacterium]|nr:glycosyltransferase [Lachnospiraceae bacterium]